MSVAVASNHHHLSGVFKSLSAIVSMSSIIQFLIKVKANKI